MMSFFMCSPIVDKVGLGFCPKTVRKAGSGVAADQTNAMLASSRTGGFSPLRRGSSALLRDLPARWRNVGLCGAPAHTPAAGAQSRTQRRHAPHGAAQALDLLAGSIGSIFSTVGKSARSARLSEIHRLPLLRYVSAKIPFSLRAATLSRTSRVTFWGVMPRLPSGSIFADSADGEPRYVESARSNSERSFVS